MTQKKKPLLLMAMDLDGTLLDSAKRVPPSAVQAMAEAVRRGRQTVFATGRGKAEIGEYLSLLPFVRYGILESGAVVYDFLAGHALEVFPLPAEKVEACLDTCGLEDAMPQFLTVEESVVTPGQLARMEEYHHGCFREMFEQVCTRTSDMRGYAAAHPDGIVKICMYHRSMESRTRSKDRLQEYDMALKYSGETSLEATEVNVTKGEALRRLCERLRIPLSQCAACGDGENDLELFAAAGFSIAMGNAPGAVRRAADAVVSGNDDGGQTEALLLAFPPGESSEET